MASKKCPKCGEDNPAEAVMCWACYTPLTGSAPIPGAMGAAGARPGAGGAAGKAGPIGAPTQEEGSKKQVDPKLFVLGGLLVVGLIIAGVMNFSGGSGGDDPSLIPSNPTGGTTPMVNGDIPMPPPPVNNAPAPTIPNTGSNAPVASTALPYNVVVPPNPKYATGTMAILATKANISPNEARGLAKFARDQFARNGKWTSMQIAVFSDATAARTFATYQARRRGMPLTAGDYQQLASSNVWAGAPAFYESTGKRENVANPSSSPMNWWTNSR